MSDTSDKAVSVEAGEYEQELKRFEAAKDIVQRNVLWAMGVGVVPIPLVDFLGITTVQLKMLKQLSEHYGVRFSEHKVKNIVGSLIGGLGAVPIGGALVFSLLKAVPFIGQVAGAVAVPIAGGAVTYAIGKVFIQHFESGGTFLDFDPIAMRTHFRREYENAKGTVKRTYETQKTGADAGWRPTT